MPRIALIGGSSLLKSESFIAAGFSEPRVVETDYGNVRLRERESDGLIFVQRHQADPDREYTQPAHINTEAIVAALVKLKCAVVVGFGSTGSCYPSRLPISALAVPDDYFNPFAIHSAFTDFSSHVVPGFDEELRQRLIAAVRPVAESASVPLITEDCVYVQSSGPRFETKAEVRWMASVGHIIGMTCAKEATLCRERQLPYALLCIVDNLANGLEASKDQPLTVGKFKEGVAMNQRLIDDCFSRIISAVAAD